MRHLTDSLSGDFSNASRAGSNRLSSREKETSSNETTTAQFRREQPCKSYSLLLWWRLQSRNCGTYWLHNPMGAKAHSSIQPRRTCGRSLEARKSHPWLNKIRRRDCSANHRHRIEFAERTHRPDSMVPAEAAGVPDKSTASVPNDCANCSSDVMSV